MPCCCQCWGGKNHLISCHKVCPTLPQAANSALGFILDVFSRSEHGRKVQLPWKQRWDAAWWQGTLLGRWARQSGVCWVRSHPGSWRLVAGEAEPGERLLHAQALVCKSGLGALDRVKPCFREAFLLKAFPLLWISETCSDHPKGKEFLKSKGLLLLRLFWFCSAPCPIPVSHPRRFHVDATKEHHAD